MATVEIVDRSEMIGKMKAVLEINPKQAAIVTVDMHRRLTRPLDRNPRVAASGYRMH